MATSISFRNDIIIRGGSPNENVFYLDGIEVPNINHFSTQGSSGGPVGLINVDLIENVDFISAAFPSNRGNTLSSVFEFIQKRPNKEKFNTSLTLGSSDLALLIDGPISKILVLFFLLEDHIYSFYLKLYNYHFYLNIMIYSLSI